MQFLVLRVVNGPESGKKMTVRSGQRVHVGRSSRADFCLAKDTSLADFHFVLDCTRGRCDFELVEGSIPGTFGEHELVSETLFDGDQFQVGTSGFALRIEGQTHPGRSAGTPQTEPRPAEEPQEPAPPSVSGFAKVEPATAELVLDEMPDVPDEIIDARDSGQTPRELFEKLAESGLAMQALQFLTFALPKREAVWALVTAIEEISGQELSPADQAGLEAVKQWVLDPTEDNRRLAEVQANILNRKTPAGFAAQAAFWSEGSIAPAGEADVPVLEPLCANMIFAGAIELASRQDDFDAALQQLIEHWTAVAEGENSWES